MMNQSGYVQHLCDYLTTAIDSDDPKVAVAQSLIEKYFSFEDVSREIRENKFQIAAFSMFLGELNREQVLKELETKPWFHKHEILTRWAWMCSQEAKIQTENEMFNHLYLCKVGSRFGRKTIDREYETFRIFLPHYIEKTQTDYLYLKKRETPDFKVKNTNGDELGIEVTEMVDENYPNKHDAFIEYLKIDFPNCIFILHKRPQWDELYDNYCVIRDWVSGLLNTSLKLEHVNNEKYNIELSIDKKATVFDFQDGTVWGNGQGVSGDRADYGAQEICELCKESIKKKLFTKKGKPRKKPEKPCVLAIYENSGILFTNFEHIENKDINNENLSWNDYFDEIWLVNYRDCVKLLS